MKLVAFSDMVEENLICDCEMTTESDELFSFFVGRTMRLVM